jgi:hypothetical protein
MQREIEGVKTCIIRIALIFDSSIPAVQFPTVPTPKYPSPQTHWLGATHVASWSHCGLHTAGARYQCSNPDTHWHAVHFNLHSRPRAAASDVCRLPAPPGSWWHAPHLGSTCRGFHRPCTPCCTYTRWAPRTWRSHRTPGCRTLCSIGPVVMPHKFSI